MVTLHSKTLLSSTRPAEKPSTGCLWRSKIHQKKKTKINQKKKRSKGERKKKIAWKRIGLTSELLLEEEASL